jgi:hypothetical protein
MNNLDNAITEFIKAYEALQVVEIQLCDAVRPELVKCKNAEDYYKLIDKLPKSYRIGIRRIYELIERLG